jgi:hypothetical protein
LKAENIALRDALRGEAAKEKRGGGNQASGAAAMAGGGNGAGEVDVEQSHRQRSGAHDSMGREVTRKRPRPAAVPSGAPSGSSRYEAFTAGGATCRGDGQPMRATLPGGRRQVLQHRRTSPRRVAPPGYAAEARPESRSHLQPRYGAHSNATAPSRYAGHAGDSATGRASNARAAVRRTELGVMLARSQSDLRQPAAECGRPRDAGSRAVTTAAAAAAAAAGGRPQQRPDKENRTTASHSCVAGSRLGAGSSRAGGGLPPSSLSRFARTSSRAAGSCTPSARAAQAPPRAPLHRLGLGSGNAMPRPSATPQRLSRPSKRMRSIHNPLAGER